MKKLVIALLALGIFYIWYTDIHMLITLEAAKSLQAELASYIEQHFLKASALYFFIYILVAASSLPGAAIITLLGAALFGFWWSLLLVSFASTIGASLAFLVSRYLFRDWVEQKFANSMKTLNQGIEKEGALYLFSLRLIPIFPFFLINLVMGLTTLSLKTFYLVSQLGMLLGTAVYLNVGANLAQIDSLSGLLSPNILLAFTLLGLFPWIAKAIMRHIKNKQVYRTFKKPKQFDNNLVVIGAGSGGLVSAYIAAAVRAKVTLIERDKMGGDCLNTGCVPSKALLRQAQILREIRTGSAPHGIKASDLKPDFNHVMEKVHAAIEQVAPHDSVERYEGLGVECIAGSAKVKSPWEVKIAGRTLTSKNLIISTGAAPFIAPIKGIEAAPVYTSDSIWSLKTLPKRFLVIGAGPIGCEIAQSFNMFGAQVTMLIREHQIMPREDKDVADIVQAQFIKEGIDLRFEHEVIEFIKEGDTHIAIIDNNDTQVRLEFDALLMAIGRKPNSTNCGFDVLDLDLRPNGTLAVNQYLQTKYPNVYAVGDVTGPYQLTHAASHQAWYAAVNALFGTFKRFAVDYRIMPAVTYTFPEVARVGINIQEATKQGIAFEVTNYPFEELDRAIAEGHTEGFVRVITAKGSDKILGATLVGPHTGELLTEFTSAMKHNLGLNKILSTIHPYPTLSEANKAAAGFWKNAHKPEKLLSFVAAFHRFMR